MIVESASNGPGDDNDRRGSPCAAGILSVATLSRGRVTVTDDIAAAIEGEHPVAHRQRVLADGAEAWTRLRALLEEHADRDTLHDPEGTPWSSREIYAHFARYQSSNIRHIQRLLALGELWPSRGEAENVTNERWAAEDRALTHEQARDWCDATTREEAALCLTMPPELWAEYGRWAADDILAPHYLSHIHYIETGGREGG